VPDKGIQDLLNDAWAKNPDTPSDRRWAELKTCVQEAVRKNKKVLSQTMNEITLQYAYPRLDVNVSKQLNHLLKSPFCIHPKTGRVCVPFDPELVEEFDPLAVPTVQKLIQEIDAYHHSHPDDNSGKISGNPVVVRLRVNPPVVFIPPLALFIY